MRVLISGHNGFVGTATKEYFHLKEVEVIGYDLMDKQDIRNVNQLKEFIIQTRPDRILHLAAIARFAEADKDPKLAFETNVLGTRGIAMLSKELTIPLVYASTGSVYMPIMGNPPITEDFPAKGNSVYACTKYMGETYVREYGTPWMILRYAHLYGKEKRFHGLIGGFLERINRGLAPTLYGGKQSNDFTYLEDVARANYLAVTAPWHSWNQVYNIGTGEEISAEEAGKLVCKLSGYAGKIEKKEGRTVDPQRFVYDVSKAERMLNFKAKFKFKDGLREMFSKVAKEGNNGVSSSLGKGGDVFLPKVGSKGYKVTSRKGNDNLAPPAI